MLSTGGNRALKRETNNVKVDTVFTRHVHFTPPDRRANFFALEMIIDMG